MSILLPNQPNQKLILPQHLTKEFIEEYRENRWLNLGDTSRIAVTNPFDTRTQEDIDNPHIFLLNLMRQPENFGYTCKTLFDKTLAPFQIAILRELWVRPFPMLLASRGAGKSWIVAVYAMLRALFNQGSKIVIVGAAFRQAKVVFDYCQDLWEKGHVYRSIAGDDRAFGPRRDVDRCSLRVGDSIIIALPIGDGSKIRGQRANIIISDEFASLPKEIFETVVRGFAAVSLDPVAQYQRRMRDEALKDLGLWTEAHEAIREETLLSNQTIISGTAYYAFNHFYEYWKQYKAIVESKGDPKKVADIFGGTIPDGFNYRDYSVIRIPVKMLPPNFMDEKSIAQAKATIHIGTYQMEYAAIFATDSNGFFKRSIIEQCVVGRDHNPIAQPSCGEVRFQAVLRGQPGREYIIAADPASEKDNFSIVVLECWPDHRRIVHCWTTTRARYKAKVRKGLTKEGDFYGYAARRIRELRHLFPASRIAIDTQGGGIAVIEALQDKDKLLPGERPFYPYIDPEDPKDTDGLAGEHILELINFAKAEWVSLANHGMKKDFEDKALLFPEFDTALLAISFEQDKASGRVKVSNEDASIEKLYDTLEDVMLEIEDLKDELATIVHTQTGTSLRDRWDTPETKLAGGKKGRLRKDRYSALLMANMVGRTMQRTVVQPEYQPTGSFAQNYVSSKDRGSQSMWIGPDWWVAGANADGANNYGAVIRR